MKETNRQNQVESQRLAVSDRGLAPGGHEHTPAPAAVFPNRSSSELLQGNTTAKSGARAANFSLVVTSPSNKTAAADKNGIEADDDVDVLRDNGVEKGKSAPARPPGNKLLQSKSSSGATMSSKVKTLADSTSTRTTPFFCKSRNSEKSADCYAHNGAEDACTADTDNECLSNKNMAGSGYMLKFVMLFVFFFFFLCGRRRQEVLDCTAQHYYRVWCNSFTMPILHDTSFPRVAKSVPQVLTCVHCRFLCECG